MRLQALFSVILLSTGMNGAAAPMTEAAASDSRRACMIEELSSDLLGPTAQERELLAEVQGDLRKIKPRSANESKELNAAVLKALNDLPIAKVSERSKRKGTFSLQEVNQLYEDVAANRQVKLTLCGGQKNGGYKGSEDGVCFARAMAVHLKALQAGAVNDNIKKIWVMGNLRAEGTRFWFHVATAVRTDHGEWYLVDPNFPKPLALSEWHDGMRGWNTDGKMRLFVTPAKNFLPTKLKKYTRQDLENGSEFFVDFLDEIYKENTGRPGPWSQLRSERKQKRLIKLTLESLGISTLAGGSFYYLLRHQTGDHTK